MITKEELKSMLEAIEKRGMSVCLFDTLLLLHYGVGCSTNCPYDISDNVNECAIGGLIGTLI